MGPHHRLAGYLLTLTLAGLAAPTLAGKADVLKAQISPNNDGSFHVAVTVRHRDTGWDHYANRWEILGPQGRIIATRTLLHPHVHEQPFTRSLGSVRIPPGLTWVKIRAHDLIHGYGGREVTVSVPGRVR